MSDGKGKLIVEIVAGLASAAGVTVALIRPWILELISRHRLNLKLVSSVGDRTTMTVRNIKGEKDVYYYYLRVENRRPSMPAKNVKVVITGRSEPDDPPMFVQKSMMVPVPLTWSFPRQQPTRITISKVEFCALGYMTTSHDGVTPMFYLSVYPEQTPRNFRVHMIPNETVRLRIEAQADDCYSKSIILELTNTDKFSDKGLSIKQVQSIT
jgi:hypothetical protein